MAPWNKSRFSGLYRTFLRRKDKIVKTGNIRRFGAADSIKLSQPTTDKVPMAFTILIHAFQHGNSGVEKMCPAKPAYNLEAWEIIGG